jgi:hypothetical protein
VAHPLSHRHLALIPDGGDGYGHIPFIVVDLLPSIVGGRVNWLLPKALARFAEGALAALLQTGGHDATGLRDCAFDVGPLDQPDLPDPA